MNLLFSVRFAYQILVPFIVAVPQGLILDASEKSLVAPQISVHPDNAWVKRSLNPVVSTAAVGCSKRSSFFANFLSL